MSQTYNNSISHKLINKTCDGRLTLQSNTPYTLSDISSSNTVYFTPVDGNAIGLYDNGLWDLFSFDEISLSLTGLTANTNYDIFAYNNNGQVTLEQIAWSNNATRNIQIVRLNGVFVKENQTDRRYLGTIRTYATGLCTDTNSQRFIWNYYNKRPKSLISYIDGQHHYTGGPWRPYANNTAVRVVNGGRTEFVCGDTTDLDVAYHAHVRYGYAALGLDASVPMANSLLVHDNSGYGWRGQGTGVRTGVSSKIGVGIGYHFLQMCQHGVGAQSSFWFTEQRSNLQG